MIRGTEVEEGRKREKQGEGKGEDIHERVVAAIWWQRCKNTGENFPRGQNRISLGNALFCKM